MTIENIPPNGPGQFAAWMKEIERQIANLNTARNLENASFTGRLRSIDDTGADRVVIGRITDDPATYGISIAEGAITVGGGTVRAIDVAVASDQVQDSTVTDTFATITSVSFARPAWATQALVQAIHTLQLSNNTGSGILGLATTRIDGTSAGTLQINIPNGETRVIVAPTTQIVNSPPSSLVVEGRGRITAGSISTNISRVTASVFWLR
ncbi:MAG: hypothetical protein ACXIVQ_12285 [Acidimicrobiales bacterium]